MAKPAGIVAFSWVAVKCGGARLPDGVTWTVLTAAGCLVGIGFTMALFIAELAPADGALDAAKVGVLAGSAVSALLGLSLPLRTSLKPAA